jgi:hypothetical protein
MKKFLIMLKDLYRDYKQTSPGLRSYKKACYRRAFGHFLSILWSVISAPFIYPIWYIFREKITRMEENERIHGDYAVSMGWFWRWVWTYGDLHDPLGWGGMPQDYRSGKNNFVNRYWYSAIRNPRFTYNFIYYLSSIIMWNEAPAIDTRDFTKMIPSYGIGDSPEGKYLVWFGTGAKWYFLYENNTQDSIFYLGWVGHRQVGSKARFEMAHRNRK